MDKNSLNFCTSTASNKDVLTLIGLGNFSDTHNQKQRFDGTRHNVGAMFLHFIAKLYNKKWTSSDQSSAFTCTCVSMPEKNTCFHLVTFSGFINQSGANLLQFLNKTRILHRNLIICVDSVDLPFGHFKFSDRLPNNQHNGLNDIKTQLQTKQLKVLQIGVDRRQPLSDWVLSSFPSSQLNSLEQEVFPQLWKKMFRFATRCKNTKDSMSCFYQKSPLIDRSLSKQHLAVLGGQWGDEGKGKLVDYYAHHSDYSTVARFAGGNNAGHTIYLGQQKYHFSLLPVTIINPDKLSVIGRNCLLDLVHLINELQRLTQHQSKINLQISPDCHLIMPYHILFDQLQEQHDRAHQPLGTTKRGIGPCLQDKTGRFGIQLKDLFDVEHFRKKLTPILNSKNLILNKVYQQPNLSLTTIINQWQELFVQVKKYIAPVWNLGSFDNKSSILFEGAQGTLLDVDFGTYPFVTSSNTISWAVAKSFPAAFPRTRLLGVFKAYTSRVGQGPFPTEIADDSATAQHIVNHGHEYGVVTKRKRRVGWFDAVLAKYACQINNFREVAITLLDVLTGFSEVKICTAYYQNDQHFNSLDSSFDWKKPFTCQYITLPGWTTAISQITSYHQLPTPARDYLKKISQLLQVTIVLVSVGPQREQVINMKINFRKLDI